MKKTLKQKLGTGMVWLGGLASLAGLCGCESRWVDEQGLVHERDIFGSEHIYDGERWHVLEKDSSNEDLYKLGLAVSTMAQTHPNFNQKERSFYAGVGALAQSQLNSKNAEKMGSRINININNQKIDGTKNNEFPLIFTYNYTKELDGKIGTTYPDEFIGIKNKFKKGEPLGLMVSLPEGVKGKRLEIKIYNSNGELSFEDFAELDYKYTSKIISGKPQNSGIYKVVSYLDGKYIAEHKFEVIEQKTDSEEQQTFPQKNLPPLFTCNYWKDFNENGITDSFEFVGVKNKFKKNERMVLVCYEMRGKECEYKIYSPSGEEIYKTKIELPNYPVTNRCGGEGDLMEGLLKKSGVGNYKAVLYIDGKLNGMCEFEIVE